MNLPTFFQIFGYHLNRVLASLDEEEEENFYEITTTESPLCRTGFGFMICLNIREMFGRVFQFNYQPQSLVRNWSQLWTTSATLSYYEVTNRLESHGFFLHREGSTITYFGTYGGVARYVVIQLPVEIFKQLWPLAMSDPNFYYIFTSGDPEFLSPKPSADQLEVLEITRQVVKNPSQFNSRQLSESLTELVDPTTPKINYPGLDEDIAILRKANQLLA